MYESKGNLHKYRKLHTLTCPIRPLTERVLFAAANRTNFTEIKERNVKS